MFGISLFNPYVLLGIVISGLGLFAYGEHDGGKRGEAKITAAWNHANEVAFNARAARIAANTATMKANQKDIDNERKAQAAANERMRGNLTIALNSLRSRPDRPSEGKPGAAAVAAGPGPDGGCTGAGLYRSDAGFLSWEADRSQRVRNQRDACYRLYGKAQEAVSKLQCQ